MSYPPLRGAIFEQKVSVLEKILLNKKVNNFFLSRKDFFILRHLNS